MKNFKNSVLILAMTFCVSCGQQKTETTQPQQQPPVQHVEKKTDCEVEEKGRSLINKLLVQTENMKSAGDKLHEVLEKHNHNDISEHAIQIETAILALMKQSKILPIENFEELGGMAKDILQISTEFAWHNKFHDTAYNTESFSELESAIKQLTQTIKNMDDVPDDICMTKEEVAINEMQTHLAMMVIYSGQVSRAMDNNCKTCITGYCTKLEDLVKLFRDNIVNLDSRDFTTMNRTLATVEHEVHEMKEQVEKGHTDEVHHSLETIDKVIERLTEEVSEASY